MNSVELFAGAGGLALAASEAGFRHLAILERDKYACHTILENRRRGVAYVSEWPEVEPTDVREFDYSRIVGPVHLVSGGHPVSRFLSGESIGHTMTPGTCSPRLFERCGSYNR